MLLQKIQERIQVLSNEAHKMHSDKKLLEKKLADIEVRTHQVVGALHELQMLQVSALKEQEAAADALQNTKHEEIRSEPDAETVDVTPSEDPQS